MSQITKLQSIIKQKQHLNKALDDAGLPATLRGELEQALIAGTVMEIICEAAVIADSDPLTAIEYLNICERCFLHLIDNQRGARMLTTKLHIDAQGHWLRLMDSKNPVIIQIEEKEIFRNIQVQKLRVVKKVGGKSKSSCHKPRRHSDF